MSKFKVYVDCDYLDGYLRYGHGEAIIEAKDIEEAKQKAKEYDDYDIIVDSYELNSHGNFDFENMKIEEIKND